MTLTFVTAYLKIYENDPGQRSEYWRIQQFRNIAETGIQLCIYISPIFEDKIIELIKDYPNIKLMKCVNISDTWIAKIVQEQTDSLISLPDNRNLVKDTKEYILLQNAKLEFMADTIKENPWNSTHFAWIDFSISYIFKNIKFCQQQLKVLSSAKLSNNFLAIPGCWEKTSDYNNHFNNNINWRFCGGFFLGNKDRIKDFCHTYFQNFPRFLEESKKLVWEVNFWAWMENQQLCKVNWFRGNHDDSILLIPEDFIYLGCSKIVSVIKYPYPEIKYFQPMSPAYFYYKERHWLNTRYVNYNITSRGGYLYLDNSNIIKNKNIVSELFLDTSQNLFPNTNDFRIMDETTVQLPELTPNSYSVGLEDIRLYSVNGNMRFIATNLNYSPVGCNRMVVGDYDPIHGTYSNCCYIIPPNPDSKCEKNWIPIVRHIENKNGSGEQIEEELFIYQWSPMEIGKIIDGHLVIIEKHKTPFPWFNQFRGSTIFISVDESIDKNQLIGVVHFSIEGNPRHYYHSLVILDSISLKPLKYSAPFYFLNRGIEFCIGFTVQENNYIFWISQNDRDPLMITVDKNSIEFILQ